jgi:hypothetical protein
VLLRCVLHECGGQGLVLRQLMQEQAVRMGQQGLQERPAELEPPGLGRPAEPGPLELERLAEQLEPELVAVQVQMQGQILVLPERQTGQLAEQLVWQPGS